MLPSKKTILIILIASMIGSGACKRSQSSPADVQTISVKAKAAINLPQTPASIKEIEIQTFPGKNLSSPFVKSVSIFDGTDDVPLQSNENGHYIFLDFQKTNAVTAYYWANALARQFKSYLDSLKNESFPIASGSLTEIVPQTTIRFNSQLPSFLGLGGIEIRDKKISGSLHFGVMSNQSIDITVVAHEFSHVLKASLEAVGLTAKDPNIDQENFKETIDLLLSDKTVYQMLDEAYADFFALSLLDYPRFAEFISPEWKQDLNNLKKFPKDVVSERDGCEKIKKLFDVHIDAAAKEEFKKQCKLSSATLLDNRFTSQIFSSALWELRKSLGPEKATKLAMYGIFLMPIQDTLDAPMTALTRADKKLHGGQNEKLIRDIFSKRGIQDGVGKPRLAPGNLKVTEFSVEKSGNYSTGLDAYKSTPGTMTVGVANGNDMSQEALNIIQINFSDGLLEKPKVRSESLAENGHYSAIRFADFNNDGAQDVVAARYIGDEKNGVKFSKSSPVLYMKDGTTFKPVSWHSAEVGRCFSVEVADIDSDGFDDISVSCGDFYSGSKESTLIFRNRNGKFSATPDWTSEKHISYSHMWANMDADSALELIVATHDQGIKIYKKAQGLNFKLVYTFPIENVNKISSGDLDEDGKIDIALSLNPGGFVVYRNESTSALRFVKIWASPTDNLSSGKGAIAKFIKTSENATPSLLTGEWSGHVTIYESNKGVLSNIPSYVSSRRRTYTDAISISPSENFNGVVFSIFEPGEPLQFLKFLGQ